MTQIVIAPSQEIVEKSARPVSIQQAPPYITRQPLYITNPTLFTANQWREIAKEPITKLCIRNIVRELVALEFEITHDDMETHEAQCDNLTNVLLDADDGDGWDIWLARWLQDALTLPIAGNAEMAPDDVTGMLGGLYHVDGATLYPTYDRDLPFVQINPYNGLDRVYFGRGDLIRLILQPRTDLQRKMYQESPIESCFTAIESLSRIYIYYMKQLGDTPMAGVLDLMDMKQDEAYDWAKNFREMFEGVDPLKIPLLYDHTKPAKFISFGRTPQDLNIIENFKRFAEIVAASFGLSIGDLRLFEHERVLAGVEASQRVTARSGVGFYAQAVEDVINQKILRSAITGFEFKFKLGMTGEDQQEAQLSATRATFLMTMTGNQAILKPADALEQAVKWKIIDIEPTGVPAAPGLEGLGLPADNLESIDSNADAVTEISDTENEPSALDQIDQIADELGAQMKALTTDHRVVKSDEGNVDRFVNLWSAAFRQIGSRLTVENIGAVIEEIKDYVDRQQEQTITAKSDVEASEIIEKAVKTASDKLDEMLEDEDWYALPDIIEQVGGILKTAYEEGSLIAVENIQKKGYSLGYTDSYIVPDRFAFRVTNPRVIELLDAHGAELVQHVDRGTKHYLKQYIVSGALNGDSTQDIIDDIKTNIFGLRKPKGISTLSDSRIRSIVNTEMNWADSRAEFDQMVAVGMKNKLWRTRGYDTCDICTANEALGSVEMDYEFETVFQTLDGAGQTTLHPPAHPNTCHCYLDSDENDIKRFFDEGAEYWSGGELDKLLVSSMEKETAQMIRDAKKKQKSLPQQLWGSTDLGKRSRFESVADAQHWLQQYSLVPIISDSDIDAKGANYAYVGVVWGSDTDEYVEAALVDVDNLPSDDIEAGRAKIFGGKGVKKSEYDNSGMIAIKVPDDIAKLLDCQLENPHITLAYFSDVQDGLDSLKKAIQNICSGDVGKSLTVRTAPNIISLGTFCVVPVELTPPLKRLYDTLKAVLYTYGSVSDATHSEFKPHISIKKLEQPQNITGYNEQQVVTFPVDGIWLHVGDAEPEFFAFSNNKSTVFDSYVDDVPAGYRKEFEEFIKRRSGVDVVGTLDDTKKMYLYWRDFMETLLVGGFDYYKVDESPLVRSVVKSDSFAGYSVSKSSPQLVKDLVVDDMPDLASASRWLSKIGYVVVPKHLPGKHNQQDHAGNRPPKNLLSKIDTPTALMLHTKRLKDKKYRSFADKYGNAVATRILEMARQGSTKDEIKAMLKEPGIFGKLKDDAETTVRAAVRSGIKIKAFYTGTGYSGVSDPDYDIPEDIGTFHRTNFEKLKRQREFLIDGNTVRTQVAEDNAGDPVTKLYDVMTFNSQDSLQKWIAKVGARPVGDKKYEIVDLIKDDNTWPTR